MKIAVEGCCHGELDTIYDTLEYLEKKNNIKVDLLLICGDFQSVRNTADMKCMAVPPKHQKMNSFYKYYSGERTAPVLTVFIGGNHEASNYLQELPYGGWVAPKIYYMGYAGVLQFGGVRIGGISGIFKGRDYMKGHHEHPPYTEDTKRSAYHMRVFDVFRIKQLTQHLDIFMSHDWPKGIHNYGNVDYLLRKKSYFRDEIENNELGNPIAADLLYHLQPSYWFSAHLHVKFPALVQHTSEANSKITKFLALDKCLPKRQFLQVLDIPHDTNKPLKLQLDPEWLAILKSTNHLLSISKSNHYPGSSQRKDFCPTQAEINAVISDFGGDLSIPENFEQTVPIFDPTQSKKQNAMPEPCTETNSQTTLLCSMLDLTDPNAVFLGKDSAIQAPCDDSVVDDSGAADDEPDDVEDYESETSFISLSESERSFSDRSLSMLSVGNESFSSVGNIDEEFKDSESKTADGRKDQSLEEIDNDEEELRQIMKAQNFEKKIRRSLSESLPKPKNEMNKYNSASSTNSSEDDVNDDAEFAEIMAAQKTAKTGSKDETESESDGSRVLSDTSIDCKSLHINDEDPELQEMLQAQKEASLRKADTVDAKKLMEVSLEHSDVEIQDIVRKQTDDGLPEIESDLSNLRPAYQSSPMATIEDRVDQNLSDKDISPLYGKGNLKRLDGAKTMGQSPVMKKFKRRNQDMYSDNSTEDDEA